MTMTVPELYGHVVQLRSLLEIKRRRLDEHLSPASRRLLNEQADALSERIDQLIGQCYRLDPDLLATLEDRSPVPGVQPSLGVIA
jgi:hypothetical protein